MGIWDGGSYKNDPGFHESAYSWQIAQLAGGAAKACSQLGVQAGKYAVGAAETQASKVVVIGKFPKYVNMANRMSKAGIKVKYFHMPDEVYRAMGSRAQIENMKFLEKWVINKGYSVRLASPFSKYVERGPGYKNELLYLLERGYELSSDRKWLIGPK